MEVLPPNHKYAFEFRDRSWFHKDIYNLLKKHNIALCIYNYKGYESPEIVTSNFIYLRLHGSETTAYRGSYSNKALLKLSQKIINWAKDGKTIFCYFDNDINCCAPVDALKLIKLIKNHQQVY